jgi:hypothetical protein
MDPEQVARQAALEAMDRICEGHAVSDREWEEHEIDGVVCFIGHTDEGRRFYSSYVRSRDWTDRRAG